MEIAWDEGKNARLKAERGLDLMDIADAIEHGDLLAILPHPFPGDPGFTYLDEEERRGHLSI